MLDATTATSASDGDSEPPVAAPVGPVGPRSARKKKRGLFHRTGVVLPALAMAVLLVVGVLVAARGLNTSGSGASGLFGSIDSLGQSKQVTALENERATIIAMNDAAETTQIIWGLGYIKSVYGTPCGAWAHEEADGYY
jgi:hypothetical protein